MCFKCEGLGHFKNDRPRNRGASSRKSCHAPGVCPPCRKGNDCTIECKSKTAIQALPFWGMSWRYSLRPLDTRGKQLMGPWSCCQARKIHFWTYQSNPRKCRFGPLFHHPSDINPRNGSSNPAYRSFWIFTCRNLGIYFRMKQYYCKGTADLPRCYR